MSLPFSRRRCSAGRLHAPALLLLGLVAAAAGPTRAEGPQPGLIVQGESVTRGQLEPLVVFSDGQRFDTTPAARAAAALTYADTQLLLYDVRAGVARFVGSGVPALRLVSPTEPDTTLGELFSEPGAIVLFESPPPATTADPLDAETFLAYWPTRAPAAYFRATEAPTPPPCTCGDLTGDGLINAADPSLIRANLADPVGSPLSALSLSCCSVIGPSGLCNLADAAVLRRFLASLPPGLAPVCSATGP